MATRTLRLTKEALAPLDDLVLSSVVGGVSKLHPECFNPTYRIDCLNDISFEHCPIPTLPIEQCV